MVALVFVVVLLVVVRAIFVAVGFYLIIGIMHLAGINPSNNANGFFHGPLDLRQVEADLRLLGIKDILIDLFIGRLSIPYAAITVTITRARGIRVSLGQTQRDLIEYTIRRVK